MQTAPPTALPPDFEDPFDTLESSAVDVRLDAALADSLRNVTKRLGTTVFAMLVAAQLVALPEPIFRGARQSDRALAGGGDAASTDPTRPGERGAWQKRQKLAAVGSHDAMYSIPISVLLLAVVLFAASRTMDHGP